MDEKARYEENLKRWSLFCPKAAEKLKQSEKQNPRLKVVAGESGPVNLKLIIDGQEYPFHNIENPLEEAKEWVKKLDLNACQVLYVYGVGLGYSYEALTEWLDNPQHFLIFIEDQFSVIDVFLHTERATRILTHPRVWVLFLEQQNDLEKFTTMFVEEHPKVVALPIYEKCFEYKFKELESKISFLRNFQQVHITEFENFGSGFFSNYFHNLFLWPSTYLGDGLFDKFHSVPAIICGAGPSLSKNIDLLAQLSGRALIFAGGSAMNAINAKGILPHFGIGIDPNFEQSTRIIMNKAFDTPFLYRSRINNGALKMVKGDLLYLSGNTGYEIANFFDKALGISPTGLEEGCNVINFSLAAAERMGCNPIILVGVDLAYSDNQSYAEGLLSHPVHGAKKLFRTKENTEELVTYKDIHGQPVLTLWKWITESLWFANFAANHPELKLINATEGGIGFKGVPNLTLKEAADQLLKEEFDLQTRVFGEVQDHPMPALATKEFIIKLIEEFSNSLERCIQKLNKAESAINTSNEKNQSEIMPLSELLQGEIAYIHVLKLLEQAFDVLHLRESKRIEIDAALLDPLVLENKRKALRMNRLKYLSQAGNVISQIIGKILQKEKTVVVNQEVESSVSNNKAPSPFSDGSKYVFDKGRFAIDDPELFLKHDEHFVLGEDIVTQNLFTDKAEVKHEWHMRHGKFHGPSRFYGPEKQLLSESWFINGFLQGKVIQYFASGALYGIQRYRDGKRHDKQERFYLNGNLRSRLSYEHGLLHGEQIMYHQNSHPARSLNFVDGKRHGLERIWNDNGKLVIEAEFNNDMPIGTARIWYENGVLAQESHFSDEGKGLHLQRYDSTGAAIDESNWKRLDYFEDIAMQTDVLTKSLSGILDSVAKAAPLVAEAGSKKSTLQQSKDLENDFKMLAKELENLRSLQDQMLFESGLDEKNTQEAIWKSPSVKRELQLKLDSMTKDLHNGVAKLQSSFGQTLDDLKKIQAIKDQKKE